MRRPTGATKSKSKLRISFDPSEATADDAIPLPVVTKPSRLAESAAAISSSRANRQEQDGPVYNKSYLEELKGSTPSTPKDISLYNSSAEDTDNPTTAATALTTTGNRALDLAAKFGTSSALSSASAIPSAAEIQEKKDRRARLAKEQQAAKLGLTASSAGGSIGKNDDYVSLDAYDSDGEFKPSRLQVASFTKADHLQSAEEYTRLVPEDEDLAEGFDSFVEDEHNITGIDSRRDGDRSRNRILMSRANPNQRQQDLRDRETLRAMIDEAEGGGGGTGMSQRHSSDNDGNASGDESDESNSSDSSDASLRHAYNAAQTSRGTAAFGHNETAAKTRRRAERDAIRPRQPEKTTSIPTLAVALGRLRELHGQAEMEKQRAEKRKAEIERRLVEVESEKGRIQQGLEELGRQLEATKLQRDEDTEMINVNGNGNGRIERGLDNIGDG